MIAALPAEWVANVRFCDWIVQVAQ